MTYQIIVKGKNEPGNNPSKVDGIGARFARLPYQIYIIISSLEEFDWVLESPFPDLPNWGLGKFIELNPQYFVENFNKHNALADYSDFIYNKDGTVYNWRLLKWVKPGMKGRHNG